MESIFYLKLSPHPGSARVPRVVRGVSPLGPKCRRDADMNTRDACVPRMLLPSLVFDFIWAT